MKLNRCSWNRGCIYSRVGTIDVFSAITRWNTEDAILASVYGIQSAPSRWQTQSVGPFDWARISIHPFYLVTGASKDENR